MHRHDRNTLVSIAAIVLAAVVVAFLLLALPACSFSLLSVRARADARAVKAPVASTECVATDNAHLAWLVTSAASSGLAGSSSVIGLFTSSPGRYIAVGASAVLGVFGLSAGVVAGHEAALFTAEGCGASAP